MFGLEAGAFEGKGSVLEFASLCASGLLFSVSKMSFNYLGGRSEVRPRAPGPSCRNRSGSSQRALPAQGIS